MTALHRHSAAALRTVLEAGHGAYCLEGGFSLHPLSEDLEGMNGDLAALQIGEYGFNPAAHTELLINMVQMGLDGIEGYAQLIGSSV